MLFLTRTYMYPEASAHLKWMKEKGLHVVSPIPNTNFKLQSCGRGIGKNGQIMDSTHILCENLKRISKTSHFQFASSHLLKFRACYMKTLL